MMRGNWDYPGGGFGHHFGDVNVAGMILMIVLWIAVIAALVIGIRALILYSRRDRTAPTGTVPPGGPNPATTGPAPTAPATLSLLNILEERYARGEIDRDEFLQRKQDLGLTGPVVPPPAETAHGTLPPQGPTT